MALAELAARLNCAEYKNWVKAGHCLVLLRDALQRFAGEQLRAFHRQLLARNPARLAPPGRLCRSRCLPRGRQFQSSCSLCTEWKKEILNHHTNRNGEVHWGNCKPWLWPSNSWELAKAYMPRGQMDISGPDKCDAAALLNLFNFCDHFSGIDQKKVREVIKCRNELMHSSEMKVSSLWLEEFGKKVQNLLKELQNVPEVITASTRVEKLLSSDWAVHIPGEEDQPDGLEGETEVCMSGSQISEIEMELIKERLKEIYLLVEEQEMLSEENLNRIQMTKNFLKDSGDLQISLQADMQRLEGLEKEGYNQRRSMKETMKEYPDQEEDEGCSLKKMKCIPKEQLL
ncbi:snRNA-activating protein complex subunit 4 [Platysternon megacephalum]|uniref:snRNA-activating protein complex subunit 4 n=1 Tax=Platysternon megacephalum TaxID=55544 RepID=A0A4D9EGP0_9SAUR|nr:snRNA-activating protein complex subunit 4 [Platysternon megacephalum]